MKRALSAAAMALLLSVPAAAADPAAQASPAAKPAAEKAAPAKKAPAKPAASKGKNAPKAPCYTKAEFEAEQAIRLHTELMVVGLTCQSYASTKDVNLFNRYKEFTLKHRKRITDWENQLVAFQKRTAKGNANRGFDTFRTRVANEMARRIAAVTEPVFCTTHAPFAEQALNLTEADLANFVSGPGMVRVAEAPRCDLPPPATVATSVVADRQAPAAKAQPAVAKPAAEKPAAGDKTKR
ncbi:MAG TPA: hypothetical protein VED40_06120 [Azospirillaceae bacterium]|nr:hypothetical protein [Azospirillaceae bacterium]